MMMKKRRSQEEEERKKEIRSAIRKAMDQTGGRNHEATTNKSRLLFKKATNSYWCLVLFDGAV